MTTPLLASFRELADHVRDPFLLVDATGRVLAANRPAREALGVTGGASNLVDLAADPDAVHRYLRLASRSRASTPGRLRLADESFRSDAGVALPPAGDGPAVLAMHLRSPTGAGAMFLALNEQIERLGREIRRREELEREREALLERERRAREEAEEASRLKDEFLATVSHELRTPLHAIMGWATLMRERDGDPGTVRRAVEVIHRNADAQAQLVDDLMDMSRIVTGRMRLEVHPISLEDLVDEAVETVRPAAEAKQIRLEKVVGSGGCVVHGDRDRLLQVVWNLLSNAVKYTPKEGRIQVVLRRARSHAEIAISDNGEGIATELLPYVFDRFRQADGSTTRRHGGLGLGLAIVRHLVELHGGLVFADSAGPGEGSTFTVTLPLPIFDRAEAALHAGAGEKLGASLQGVRIVLVEDHEDSRHLLENILQGTGAIVEAHSSSSSALAALSDRAPDIVISDLQMPEEDGFSLIRKIRDAEVRGGRSRVPAIALSAHTGGTTRVQALRAGFQAFLGKPVHTPELLALVRSLLDGAP